jgi:hypothetical protein
MSDHVIAIYKILNVKHSLFVKYHIHSKHTKMIDEETTVHEYLFEIVEI